MSSRFPWIRFNKLHAMLKKLERDVDSISLLADSQFAIIRNIKTDERNVAKLKRERSALKVQLNTRGGTKEQSQLVKLRIAEIDARIKRLNIQIYYWRCFGDAIVYLYIDASAIKTLFYELDSLSPRRTAGYLGGKKGHRLELRILRHLHNDGVPALLSDSTNVIRYGDLCLLVSSDPFVIEVKSSKQDNDRCRRQIASLQRISDFFITDNIPLLRGLGPGVRVQTPTAQISYQSDLKSILEEALSSGSVMVELEQGMSLLVARSEADIQELIMQIPVENDDQLILCNWNAYKYRQDWLPFKPFLQAFDTASHFKAMIDDKIALVVAINLTALARHARTKGLRVEILDDQYFILELSDLDSDPALSETLRCRVSYFYLNRALLELTSASWLIENSWHATLEHNVQNPDLDN